eukprot:gene17663-23250_t
MFEWVDGPLVTAMKLGHIFVLDEINLADDAIIERINSVLESNRTITLAEKGGQSMDKLTAHPDFKILATMNPGGDYGKRELSPALRSRFSEIYIPQFSYTELEYEDMRLVIREILHFDSIALTISSNSVTNIIIDVMRYMHELTADMKINNVNISVRDVLAWAKFVNYWIKIINVTELSDIAIFLAIGHGMHMIILDGLGIGMSVSRDIIHVLKFKILNKFTSLIPLNLRQSVANKISNFDEILIPKYTNNKFILSDLGIDLGSEKIQSTYPQNYELSISTSINFYRIIRASQIHRPILLEGPPGVGKTSLISTLASLSGHRLIRINLSEHTELSDLLGTDLPSDNSDESDQSIGISNKFVWKDGVFLQAMKSGDWILLDELNLASQSVLEGLNACLDHREEIYIPDIDQTIHRHANFRIFCAQNPMIQGGGRKGLPKSFLSRFSKIQSYISEYMVPNIIDDDDFLYENKINALRSEGSPKPIKHRAMNDLFESLKDQGINHYRSQIPGQLRDFPTLLSSLSPPLSAELLGDLTWDNSLPLTSFNKGENYFYRNMTELSQLRNQSYVYISSDISQRESQLMIGISESLFLDSVRLRSILSEQFENYKELSKQIEILASFVESNAKNNKEIEDFISTTSSIILDSLLFMSSLLETYKKSNNEDLLESKPFIDRLEDIDTLLGYKSNFIPAKTIDLNSFNELLQKTLDVISNEAFDLNAIFGSDFIQREEEGKSSKDNSNGQKIQDNLDGTGMGEGEGLTDVSNQLTNEEQILGQKENPFDNKEDTSDLNEKKDVPKEKEKPDSGVEMSQDFEGDMVNLPEDVNSEEAEDQDDNEVDRDDLDRELGEADLNDIVDEKQWNSDEESDVEENAEDKQKDKFEKHSKMFGKELDEMRTKEADEEKENNNNKDDGNNSVNENAADDGGLNYDSDSDLINELKDDDNMEKPYDQRPKDNDNHSDSDDNDLDQEKNEEVGLEDGDPTEEENSDVITDALPDKMEIDDDNIDENVEDDVNFDQDDNVDIDEDDQRMDDTMTNEQTSVDQEQLDEKKDDNDLIENLNKYEVNPKTNNKKAGPITYGVNAQGSSEQVLGTESSEQRTGEEPADSSENDINPSESQENSEKSGGEGDDGRNNSGNSGGQDRGSKPDNINKNTSNNEKTSRDNFNKSSESTPLPNPFREKGDINKMWHRRLNVTNDVNINEVEDNQDDAITEDNKLEDNSTKRQFEYVTNETDTSDMQVLANEPNAEAINTSNENCEDTENDQKDIIDSSEVVDKVKDKEIKSDRQRKRKYPDSSEPLNDLSEELSAESLSEQQVNKSPKLQEINDDLTIDYPNISINEVIHSDVNFSENNENDNCLDDDFSENADSHINDISLPIATNRWQKNRMLTESASARLCEQLRLILEPTLTTRLQGDYRSGKRINMRKVITYIASGYRKDKIWLRRTKPAKRDYHVMLMIDNTKSMAAAGSLALSSLSTLANALTRLESGELCVCSFSDSLQVVHPFNKPFNDLAGIDMFTKFTFLSERTLLAKSLSMAGKIFEANRGNNENRKCMRLLFVVSDARIDSDNRINLKHVIRQLFEINVLLVLLIVDNNQDSRDSIFNTKTVSFIDNKIISTSYLDEFPFPYYVTVQQIERLPELLSSALKQWFEIIQTNEI